VNKFGDKIKKIQCHSINSLVSMIRSAQREHDTELPMLILSEILVFLARPGTKPSHRVYCLGFLNKLCTMAAADTPEVRQKLLSLYFGLFNKMLHQGPTQQVDLEEMKKALKKDRTISKKDRFRKLKKLKSNERHELDEEDNKVIELVLKGINTIMAKAGDARDLHQIIQD
jgi:hypothetical protein